MKHYHVGGMAEKDFLGRLDWNSGYHGNTKLQEIYNRKVLNKSFLKPCEHLIYFYYVAMISDLLHKSYQSSHWVQSGHAPGSIDSMDL